MLSLGRTKEQGEKPLALESAEVRGTLSFPSQHTVARVSHSPTAAAHKGNIASIRRAAWL